MDYDSSSIWSAASSQICRGLGQTTAQSQACRTMLDRTPLTDWLCSTPVAGEELKKIIWIKPAKSQDKCVSNIALETVNALRKSDEIPQDLPTTECAPVVLHSVHQTELPYLAYSDTKRTTLTLLKEAIFQLLVCHPPLVLKHKALETLSGSVSETAKLSLQDLGSLMRELLDTFPSGASGVLNRRTALDNPTNQTSHSTQPIFWIIDRIDDCAFSHRQGASKLYDFAKLLDNLVGGPNGRLRVLITSLYPPQQCDPKWAFGFENDEEGLKSWVECEYACR